ncbi:hypothetical protein CPB83DRAFT_775240 [Crepidotus variabilis]|uniref:Uncharacterized protein n=1 Tax=Crepidotus variabilis TaxID=179855 RepID=A0A9P6E6M2_9AGAR|nr:hypothetical protein CPB83DRAFT_775240 [Crepidotus variabilis]
MVDWSSQATALAARDAFIKLLHIYLGLYLWEILTTLDFEWRMISGQKKFKWPLAFYFLNRYVCLAALIGANLDDCRGIFVFTLFMIHLTLTLASLNLAIRTIAIWEQNKVVIACVAILATFHCFLCIYQSATSVIARVPGVGCFPSSKNYAWDTAIYVYALVFDTLAMGLNVYKLRSRLDIRKSIFHASSITIIVFRQGIIYFIIAFLVNIVAIAFLVLDLNIGTIGSSTCFASTVCTVSSC